MPTADAHAYSFDINRDVFNKITHCRRPARAPPPPRSTTRATIAGFGTDATGDWSNRQVASDPLSTTRRRQFLSVLLRHGRAQVRRRRRGVDLPRSAQARAPTHGFRIDPVGGSRPSMIRTASAPPRQRCRRRRRSSSASTPTPRADADGFLVISAAERTAAADRTAAGASEPTARGRQPSLVSVCNFRALDSSKSSPLVVD